MAGTAGPRLGLVWGYNVGETGWGVSGFNPNFAALELLVHLTVYDVKNDPPASPINGECYIVGDTPTGAWAGFPNTVAAWFTTGTPAWKIVYPAVGVHAYNLTTSSFWLFDGFVWIEKPSGGASVSIADSPPSSPNVGDMWWSSEDGQLYLWYDDGSSAQFVPAMNLSGVGGGGGGTEAPRFALGEGLEVDETTTPSTISVVYPMPINMGGTGTERFQAAPDWGNWTIPYLYLWNTEPFQSSISAGGFSGSWGGPTMVAFATSDTGEASFDFGRARGSADSLAPLLGGDVIGRIYFDGYAPGGWDVRATITVSASEDWGDNNHGTMMEFLTTPSGTVSSFPALKIGGTGNVMVGAGLEVAGSATFDHPTMKDLSLRDTAVPTLSWHDLAGNNYGIWSKDNTLVLGTTDASGTSASAGLTLDAAGNAKFNGTVSVKNNPILDFNNDLVVLYAAYASDNQGIYLGNSDFYYRVYSHHFADPSGTVKYATINSDGVTASGFIAQHSTPSLIVRSDDNECYIESSAKLNVNNQNLQVAQFHGGIGLGGNGQALLNFSHDASKNIDYTTLCHPWGMPLSGGIFIGGDDYTIHHRCDVHAFEGWGGGTEYAHINSTGIYSTGTINAAGGTLTGQLNVVDAKIRVSGGNGGYQYADGGQPLEVWQIAAGGGNTFYYNTAAAANVMLVSNAGDLTIMGGTAIKVGGGSWVAPSDIRLKREITPYKSGLAQIIALQPITYQYNGKGGQPDDGRSYTGLDADEAEKIMPELVGSMKVTLDPVKSDEPKYIEPDTEIKTIDSTALVYALVNSCKELAARVELLEEMLKGAER